MSRYIPKKVRDAAPCCEHCTPDEYDSIHHIFPYALLMEKGWTDCHTHNILKVCRKCHIKHQFEQPKFVYQSNFDSKEDCYICKSPWGFINYVTHETDYNDWLFSSKHICKRCANRWAIITNNYKEHLQKV